MNEEPITVPVQILDKEYRISCQPDEEADLHESARIVDQRMREIRQAGRVLGADRIAVMAALNIAYDLTRLQSHKTQDNQDLDQRLGNLQERLGEALATRPRADEDQVDESEKLV